MQQYFKLTYSPENLRKRKLRPRNYTIAALIVTGFSYYILILTPAIDYTPTTLSISIGAIIMFPLAIVSGYFLGKALVGKVDNSIELTAERMQFSIDGEVHWMNYSELKYLKMYIYYVREMKGSGDSSGILLPLIFYLRQKYYHVNPEKKVLLEIDLKGFDDNFKFYIDGVSYNEVEKFVQIIKTKLNNPHVNRTKNGVNMEVDIYQMINSLKLPTSLDENGVD